MSSWTWHHHWSVLLLQVYFIWRYFISLVSCFLCVFLQMWLIYIVLFLLIFIFSLLVLSSDVVNEGSLKQAVDEVEKLVQAEGLNCLINNAGINVPANFHTVTPEKLMENFSTNTVAPLMISQVMFLLIIFLLIADLIIGQFSEQNFKDLVPYTFKSYHLLPSQLCNLCKRKIMLPQFKN